jgi:hypothetical protein
MQVKVTTEAARAHALALIRAAQSSSKQDRPHFDFITLALNGRKIGFDKVIAMIVNMKEILEKEQADDDNKV